MRFQQTVEDSRSRFLEPLERHLDLGAERLRRSNDFSARTLEITENAKRVFGDLEMLAREWGAKVDAPARVPTHDLSRCLGLPPSFGGRVLYLLRALVGLAPDPVQTLRPGTRYENRAIAVRPPLLPGEPDREQDFVEPVMKARRDVRTRPLPWTRRVGIAWRWLQGKRPALERLGWELEETEYEGSVHVPAPPSDALPGLGVHFIKRRAEIRDDVFALVCFLEDWDERTQDLTAKTQQLQERTQGLERRIDELPSVPTIQAELEEAHAELQQIRDRSAQRKKDISDMNTFLDELEDELHSF